MVTEEQASVMGSVLIKQDKLQSDIKNLIDAFEENTGEMVKGISLTKTDTSTASKKSAVNKVSATVNLYNIYITRSHLAPTA